MPVPQALAEPHDFHCSAVKYGAPPFPKMNVPGLVYPCHPLFRAAYTTGAELALAGPSAKAAPPSTGPRRTAPASSILAIFDVLATELSPVLQLPLANVVPVSCPEV